MKFEDEAVADYIDRQVDLGLRIEQFARIWIHTHPGHSASPSNTDEETFERCFGSPDWAVMFILARGGQTYARLRFSSGPGGAVILPVEIDFGQPFAPSDWASWDAEFARSVTPEVIEVSRGQPTLRSLAPSGVARELALDRSVLDGAMLLDERAFGEWWDEDLFRKDPRLRTTSGSIPSWRWTMHITVPRFERQADLVPRERLESRTVSVIGVGAIGRQVAMQLAALGARRLQLIDFDRIEPTNITTQGYRQEDLGLAKVTATGSAVTQLDPQIALELVEDRYRPQHVLGDAIFCCVDSIDARAAIWRSAGRRCSFWCDGRVLGEVMRILCVAGEQGRSHYPTALFQAAEAQVGACTTRGVIYTASIAAGLMTHQFIRWLRGQPVDSDLSLNLLASELTAG